MSGTGVYIEEGTKGVAWRLLADSTSGGKVYTVAVIGNQAVYAWGRADVASQYGVGSQVVVTKHRSHAAALAAAQEKTDAKARRNYYLDIQPTAMTFTGGPNMNHPERKWADFTWPVAEVVRRIFIMGNVL